MRRLPSRWSIVWTDSLCQALTTIAPMVFVVALMVKLTGTVPGGRGKPARPVDPEAASIGLACTTALVGFLFAIVALRVARIRRLFDEGEEVEATVLKVSRLRGGTRLKLEFERAGETYRVRLSFQRRSTTPTFEEGTRIPVLVDPFHPRRAVPLALYASPGAPPAGGRDGSASVEHPSASRRGPRSLDLPLTSRRSRSARTGDER